MNLTSWKSVVFNVNVKHEATQIDLVLLWKDQSRETKTNHELICNVVKVFDERNFHCTMWQRRVSDSSETDWLTQLTLGKLT